MPLFPDSTNLAFAPAAFPFRATFPARDSIRCRYNPPVDHHAVATVAIAGSCLDVLGTLYLAYDLLGGQHGPLRLLTRAVTYSIIFGLGYGLGMWFGPFLGLITGAATGITISIETFLVAMGSSVRLDSQLRFRRRHLQSSGSRVRRRLRVRRRGRPGDRLRIWRAARHGLFGKSRPAVHAPSVLGNHSAHRRLPRRRVNLRPDRAQRGSSVGFRAARGNRGGRGQRRGNHVQSLHRILRRQSSAALAWRDRRRTHFLRLRPAIASVLVDDFRREDHLDVAELLQYFPKARSRPRVRKRAASAARR